MGPDSLIEESSSSKFSNGQRLLTPTPTGISIALGGWRGGRMLAASIEIDWSAVVFQLVAWYKAFTEKSRFCIFFFFFGFWDSNIF